MENGREPIDDDELLYRRIPVNTGWYKPESGYLNDAAFGPKEFDTDGISIARSRYTTPEEEAKAGRKGKSYYVAVFSAREAKELGIEISPSPDTLQGYNPAHAVIPSMNASNRYDTDTLNKKLDLKKLSKSILGPFEGENEPEN